MEPKFEVVATSAHGKPIKPLVLARHAEKQDAEQSAVERRKQFPEYEISVKLVTNPVTR